MNLAYVWKFYEVYRILQNYRYSSFFQIRPCEKYITKDDLFKLLLLRYSTTDKIAFSECFITARYIVHAVVGIVQCILNELTRKLPISRCASDIIFLTHSAIKIPSSVDTRPKANFSILRSYSMRQMSPA